MIAAKGYAAQAANEKLSPWEFERRELGNHDVQIQILYCGVCHSDLHNITNHWGNAVFPLVPGHEIVGKITAVGCHIQKFKIGDSVAVGTYIDSCRTCEDCTTGHEQFCEVQPVATYNGKDKEGQPTYGGYSNNIVVSEDFTFHVSEKLDLPAVAPLLCAGATTWSPLRKWKVGKGDKLAVVGLGGLGHMGVKFAVALGAEVTVISTSPNKKEAAKKLGAHHFLVSKDEVQLEAAYKTFDFILDTVPQDHDINPYLTLLRADGIYINVGLPPKPWEVSSFALVVGNKTMTGSGVGGLLEVQEMLDFCAENNIVADIELIDIKDINKAFVRMEKGDVLYRFVIDMATL